MQVLDHEHILRNTPGLKDLSVTLKKKQPYGVGIFATRTIKKGDTIAFYRMRVYSIDRPSTPYSFCIYTERGNESRRLSGDIFSGSHLPPKDGIPYWAYFSNEPGPNDQANAYMDENNQWNYKDRKVLRVGDTVEYKLVATRCIHPKEQIFWCYGDSYDRDYDTSC